MTHARVVLVLLAVSLVAGCKGASPSNQNAPANANRAVLTTEVRDEHGATELKKAVDNNDTEEVRRLIDSGADVNAATPEGVTPLMNASGFGNKEAVEMLIAKGADVNARTKSNWTALMAAALSGQKEIIEILLAAGADPAVKDIVTNKTAADVAQEKNHKDIVELFKKRGVAPSAKK
jgi:ankyrin repeat protein